jgi:hypothetical protein
MNVFPWRLDILSMLFTMGTVVTCSKIGSGVELDIEVMASLWSYDGIETASYLNLLPVDGMWE